MRVLILGANGFIGSAVVAALRAAGMDVRAVVRDDARLQRRFPGMETVDADLRDPRTHDAGFWKPALDGAGAVVNAAGVLQPRRERDAWAVHGDAPAALYAACSDAGVRRVVHVSAIGVAEAETVYARSKRAGEEALRAHDLDWTILRPAVVIGDGSYGGTSMMRAMAAFPFVQVLIGDGTQPMDFIHKDDLAAGIVRLLETGAAKGEILEPAGPERTTFAGALAAYRGWLGIEPAPSVRLPMPLIRALARLGDALQVPPITTTAVAQMEARLTGDAAGFAAATGIEPRRLGEILAGRPAETQDLWHARLWLLRPAVRFALALIWLASGAVGLAADPARYAVLVGDEAMAHALGVAASLIDLAIAAALIFGWRLREVAAVQFAAVLGYTAVLTVLAPGLWADLYGGLLKNLAVLALIAVHAVLERER